MIENAHKVLFHVQLLRRRTDVGLCEPIIHGLVWTDSPYLFTQAHIWLAHTDMGLCEPIIMM